MSPPISSPKKTPTYTPNIKQYLPLQLFDVVMLSIVPNYLHQYVIRYVIDLLLVVERLQALEEEGVTILQDLFSLGHELGE